MYPLLKQEIDRLMRGYGSPCLGLFGAFGGAFVSLLITDLTANIDEPAKRYFIDSTVMTGCAAFVFFLLAVREWWEARRIVADLKKEIVEIEVVQKGLPFGSSSEITEHKN
jgi:hypothetical protein